ncbi:putrescine transport system substrate-binding protein [Rhodoblastus acidophilus]|uniref:polyamine ABC transporter substrate-binding protein n=1 Tax=Rhodoblastus acidophilus TaxID=1074 RepID=UPI002223EFC9|nr:polyamine ABC transporter substrate-binding protein [Rhodoblastus acidophilus]MCW2316696.1 putrescine transport system substrate-binding protein [Rhodoblastus acidophilus]
MKSNTFRQMLLTGAALLIGAAPAAAADTTLNIYNWNDYIAPDTVPAFEKATGIKVTYDLYDANETLEGKLSAGGSGYDIVVPTLIPFAARQIKGGFYQKLDKSKLKNYAHLDKNLLARMATQDEGNSYLVPWMSGTVVMAYNVDMIKKIMPDAPVDSLKMLFDPAVAAKFKGCGISIMDSPTEVFPPALISLGLNPDSKKPEDLKKAAALLMKTRPSVRRYDSAEYINALANGDICIAWGYSSDMQVAKHRAQEAGKGVAINVVIPKEGAQRYIDVLAIPKDAPHAEAALKFIDFVMQPEEIAKTSSKIYVMSGNADAKPFVAPEVASDPTIFPPPEVEKTIYTITGSDAATDRLRTRLWTEIKTGH